MVVTYDIELGGLRYHSHLEPCRDESGQVVGVTGIAVDVTDREAGVVLSVLALAAEDGGTARHLGTAEAEDGAYPGAALAAGADRG